MDQAPPPSPTPPPAGWGFPPAPAPTPPPSQPPPPPQQPFGSQQTGWPPSPPAQPAWPQGAGPVRELQLASYGSRLGAFALDGVFIAMIVVVGVLAGGSVVEAAISPATTATAADANLPGYVIGVLIALLSLIAPPFVYPALGWHSGATPAMRILSLRVVDARSGDRLTWGQTMLRAAGWWWSLLTIGIGFLPALGDPWRRGLPDRMASSLVLTARPLPMTWVPGPYGWVAWPVRPPAPAPLIASAPSAAEPPPVRSAWTWTDVVPVLVTMLPIILAANWVAGVTAQGLGITAGSGGAVALSYADEIGVYGASLLLIVLLVKLRRHAALLSLGFRLPAWPWLAAGIPMGFAALVLQEAGGLLSKAIFPGANSTNQCVGIRGEFGSSLALALLAVAVIAPIAEEIIFRGFTFGWLQGRLPLWGAVLISAAIFSAAHVGWAEPSLFLPVFLSGILLAYLYARSRSLWPGVIVHMTINIVGVILILRSSGC